MPRAAVWTTIRDALESEISTGRYGPGDRLPTEAQLSERFGVNRHTVRRAIADLAQSGAVLARRGAGVFVTQNPTSYPIGTRVRFHQNLTAAGHIPSKKYLHLTSRSSDAREAEALRLNPGEMVHVSEGLTFSDGQPIALFRSLFPALRFPDMLDCLRANPSVTAALAHHGVQDYTRSRTELTAKEASATQALHLQIRPGSPILRSVGVNSDSRGAPVEYGRTWFAGDRVSLVLDQSDLA